MGIVLPQVSSVLFFSSQDSTYLYSSYQGTIGEYITDNHFINQDEFIGSGCYALPQMSFSVDMMERYLLLTKQQSKEKYKQSWLDHLGIELELKNTEVLLSYNFNDFEVNFDRILVSVIADVRQDALLRIDRLQVSNHKADIRQKDVKSNSQQSKNWINTGKDKFFVISEDNLEEDDEYEVRVISNVKIIFYLDSDKIWWTRFDF